MSFGLAIVLLVGLVVLISILLGPLWLNRNDLPPGENQNKCIKHITDPKNDPRNKPRPDDAIKIIRLTNSGEFVDRCELTDVLYELNWDRERPSEAFGVAVKPSARKLPRITILYVHGWKHDADPKDTDLQNFTRLINDLRKRHENQKYVVGVYVGWNATARLPGFLENISFWVKKNNADRIAQSSIVTKIVGAIGAVTKGEPNRLDQFIAIGHSFGSRVLFSATAQSLVYECERAHPGFPTGEYRIVEGSADAVILLNPAFEASRYTAIDDITRYDEHFKRTQPPLLITVSTDNDWATKMAFPIGQWLGLSRSERELTTLGNYQPFFTHDLSPTKKGNVSTNNLAMTEEFCAAGLRLTRLANGSVRRVVQAQNPFVVARTTKAVIDGHNGIWAADFRAWLVELIGALETKNEQAAAEKVAAAESA
ncbi:pimeloyl-ACP methyl ester carboxylesterase [Bradyrhizobium algeriense]|uniref:Pimeloyl-ACP methyl ester carboxylesterase n=1 Tax=Bradyrhizobium algeriense TaxID=634784 RepID=A0ABU8B7G8_9BRAD